MSIVISVINNYGCSTFANSLEFPTRWSRAHSRP